MRIKFGDILYEVTQAVAPENSRYMRVNCHGCQYVIDCESPTLAQWLMATLLTEGYFNASGVDYTYDLGHFEWYNACESKTEEQMKFAKWINPK